MKKIAERRHPLKIKFMKIFETTTPKWVVVLITVFILITGLIIYRYNWWTFVDSYELGYKYDMTTGKITVLNRTGWSRITPFISEIHTVDTRPVQIRIEANVNGSTDDNNDVNKRVLNAMLVRFKPAGLMQLLSYHGRQNYDQKLLAQIFKIYAYEGCATDNYSKEKLQKKYQFLEIMSTTSNAAVPDSTINIKTK